METTTRKRRLIVISLMQHFAALFSVFIQFHGLMYLYMLYRKRNIGLVVAHFAGKRNLFLGKCKDLKLRRLCRKQRSPWFNAVILLIQLAGLARQARLHGKFSARLAGIPANRAENFSCNREVKFSCV